MIIAIDGPAGSGKSTIAKLLAENLNIEYIDSGAIYRTITLYGLKNYPNGCEGNEEDIYEQLNSDASKITITYEDHTQIMWLEGQNVSKAIRDPKVTVQVKYIADHQDCRNLVNQHIRKIAEEYPVVIDGRDIGTIVFPNAKFKFYLDADTIVRSERRAKELNIPLEGAGFDELLQNIKSRDKADMERTIAPLKKADDAIYIDTSDLGIQNVLDEILASIK